MRHASLLLALRVTLLLAAASAAQAQWTSGACQDGGFLACSVCCIDWATQAERDACFEQDCVGAKEEGTLLDFGVPVEAVAGGDTGFAVSLAGQFVQCLVGASVNGPLIPVNGGQSTGGQSGLAHLGSDVYAMVYRTMGLNVAVEKFDCETNTAQGSFLVDDMGPNRFLPKIVMHSTTAYKVLNVRSSSPTDEVLELREYLEDGTLLSEEEIPLNGLAVDRLAFDSDLELGDFLAVEDSATGTITVGFGSFEPGSTDQFPGTLGAVCKVDPWGIYRTFFVVYYQAPTGDLRLRAYEQDGSLYLDRQVLEEFEGLAASGVWKPERSVDRRVAHSLGIAPPSSTLSTYWLDPVMVGNVASAPVFPNATSVVSVAGDTGSLLLVAEITTAQGGAVVAEYFPGGPLVSLVPVWSHPGWLGVLAVGLATIGVAVVSRRRPATETRR